MVKRNDIVSVNDDNGAPFTPYGRVSRFMPDGKVEVLICSKDRVFVNPDELSIHNDYTGYWHRPYSQYPVFIRMATLRQLKRMVARYDIKVWKRYRKHPYDIETTEEYHKRRGI